MAESSRLDPYIPRIPVIATVGLAFLFLFTNLRLFLICVALPLTIAEALWFACYFALGLPWGGTLFGFVSVLPATLFGVAWCRVILLGPELAPPRFSITLSRDHLRFAIVLLLALAVIIPVRDGFLQLADRTGTQFGYFGLGVYFLILALCIAVTLRFQLALPGIAVGEKVSIGRAWDLSREQGFRLLVCAALVYAPVTIFQQVVNELFEISTGLSARWVTVDRLADFDPRYISISIVNAICDHLHTALLFLVVSFSFRRITRWEPPAPPSFLERFD